MKRMTYIRLNNKRKNKQESTYSLSISKNQAEYFVLFANFLTIKIQLATGSLQLSFM